MGNNGRNSGGGQSQADLDNHANQLNPNNDAYTEPQGRGEPSLADLDNHADQMNPNNDK